MNVFIDEIAKQALERCDAIGIAKPSHREMFACGYREGIRKCPWHKVADGDLPKDGQLVLISNPAIQFAIFNKLFLPVLRVGRRFEAADNRMYANVEYWMEIPELPKED